jgi:Ca2+-binding EF-hand superfamily protein
LIAAIDKEALKNYKVTKETFEQFDQNSKGYLDMKDFKYLLGKSHSDKEIQKIIQEVDVDKNQKISFQ